jgi:ferric-dicitrate binding protein FerR (iron transport regulator)
MKTGKMKELFIKFINRECTEEEVQQIIDYFKSSNDLEDVPTIEAVSNLLDAFPDMELPEANRIFENILKLEKQKKNKPIFKRNNILRFAAAAIFIGLISTTFVFRNHMSNTPVETAPVIVNTIQPGTDKATLTLEDGSVVTLEKGAAFQTKNASSTGDKIVYRAAQTKNESSSDDKTESKREEHKVVAVAYNYLTIPRGGQFSIELTDGTQVWLNSESQLKYPVNFIEGKTREVELVYGEAYFEVSPSTNHKGSKFRVIHKAQEIEVLGTAFNLKAYKDESNIYTTLVEGKVEINTPKLKQILRPTQRSNVDIIENKLSVSVVDVSSEISWKNGIFTFNGMPLKGIMKVLSRWYDVEVVFENKDLESVKFRGVIERDQSIEEILSIMKSNAVDNYEIKDKMIIIK